MEWTTAKPTKTGYYWVRREWPPHGPWTPKELPQGATVDFVEVESVGGWDGFTANGLSSDEPYHESDCGEPGSGHGLITAWYGPIEPPPLPEGM